MYHYGITKDDMKNGEGLRIVLWVAGCEHHCPECHNPQTWDCDRGEPFTCWEEAELMELVKQKHISGVTFTGGDPLHPANRNEIGRLAKKISELPEKDIWLYTGYTLNFLAGNPILVDKEMNLSLSRDDIPWIDVVDVIVDGRFEPETRRQDILKGADPNWRGSSNQRIINVKESFKQQKIIEKEESL